ncbi:hypothetical protein M5E88_07595 [Akkermansia muciniphila]|nr:hypothetical protein M5E88_07595 [Akkermansia muciniphila]
MKPASTILALSVSCLPGFISPIAAQEEQPRQPDAQQQEEEKDTPVITNPAVFNEKDLDKLLEKQREYIKNIIQITASEGRARNMMSWMAATIQSFICKTKMKNGS